MQMIKNKMELRVTMSEAVQIVEDLIDYLNDSDNCNLNSAVEAILTAGKQLV